MSSYDVKDQAGLNNLVNAEFGDWSDSVTVTQDMINQFAELSGDHMWMHVDEARCAKESPYGTTIAHGFLLLSMISKMPSTGNIPAMVTGWNHMMNYGSDKLRFLGAVPVNSEIHSRGRIKAIEVHENKTKVIAEQHIQMVGADKPAVIYELVFVFL